MSGNSGAGGFNRAGYERALTDFRKVLQDTPMAGMPHRAAELYELQRLIGKYPAEARELLARDTDPPPGASSPDRPAG